METRVAVISIIVEQEDAIEELNILLHEARQYIVPNPAYACLRNILQRRYSP